MTFRSLACIALTALAGSACDSFDFGRLVGGEVPPVASASATPAPSKSPPTEMRAPTITVVVAGALDFSGFPAEAPADGDPDPFETIRPLFDGGARLAHLVSPLTTERVVRRAGLAGPPRAADVIAALGIDAVSVATGHAWDAGKKGFLQTLSVLSEAGVPIVGGGETREATLRPTLVLAEGWSIAILSATAAWPYGPLKHHEAAPHVAAFDPEGMAKAIRAAKAEHDLVIVALDGQKELSDVTTTEDHQTFAALVDAGADLLVGSGAHLPKGIHWKDGRPMLFGVGNLLGGADERNPWTKRGIVARVTFADGKSPTVEVCPYTYENGRPERLAGPRRAMNERFFHRGLARLSEGEDGSLVGEPARYGCMRTRPRSAGAERDGG